MPRAWLARFGRTVGEQAIEAVEARFDAPREPGLSGTVGGQSLSGFAGPSDESGEFWGAESDTRQGVEALSEWFGGEAGDEDKAGFGTRALTGEEMLAGTSFGFTEGTAELGFASFWGRGAVSSFDGREGDSEPRRRGCECDAWRGLLRRWATRGPHAFSQPWQGRLPLILGQRHD